LAKNGSPTEVLPAGAGVIRSKPYADASYNGAPRRCGGDP